MIFYFKMVIVVFFQMAKLMLFSQVQATVVGTLAAFFAAIMGWVKDGESGSEQIHHATLLCASSLVTATIASLILGSLMIAVILFSRKCGINPDNVATPIAASLGDLTTLALLSGISGFLYKCIGEWLSVPTPKDMIPILVFM